MWFISPPQAPALRTTLPKAAKYSVGFAPKRRKQDTNARRSLARCVAGIPVLLSQGANDPPARVRSTIKPWPPLCAPAGSGPTTMCFSYGVQYSWMEMLCVPPTTLVCLNGVQKAHACLASKSNTARCVCGTWPG